MNDDDLTVEQIDPITMARFMVLPGAVRLLRAYAQIPPGNLRSASIMQVEAMADTYAAPPEDYSRFDPLQAFSGPAAVQAPPPSPSLPSPRQERPQLSASNGETPEMRAVIHMMNGVTPADAAKLTGLSVAEVNTARATAKARGVTFPRVKMTQVVSAKPVRSRATDEGLFALTEDQVEGRLHKMMEKAAKRLGVSLGIFFELRRRTVSLVHDGKKAREISETLGVDLTTITNWVYRIRQLGLDNAPLPEVEPVAPTQGTKGRATTFPLSEDEVTQGRHALVQAAERLGISVEEYFRKRRRAVQLLTGGDFTAAQLASDLGVPLPMATHWKTSIIALGLNRRQPQAVPA